MKFASTMYKLGIVLTCALSINFLVARKAAQAAKTNKVDSQETGNQKAADGHSHRGRHVLKKGLWG